MPMPLARATISDERPCRREFGRCWHWRRPHGRDDRLLLPPDPDL